MSSVYLFGEDGCPYCLKIKNLLIKEKIDVFYLDTTQKDVSDLYDKMVNDMGIESVIPITVVQARKEGVAIVPGIDYNDEKEYLDKLYGLLER